MHNMNIVDFVFVSLSFGERGVPARVVRDATRIIILFILCRSFCMHACGQIEE